MSEKFCEGLSGNFPSASYFFRNTRKFKTFLFCLKNARSSEAVVQSCSVKKVFLKISQNSQEITCARVSFLIKLQA